MFILSFLLRRLLQGSLIILLVTFIIFTLLRVVPGDPARLIVGGMAPDVVVAQKAKELGLELSHTIAVRILSRRACHRRPRHIVRQAEERSKPWGIGL